MKVAPAVEVKREVVESERVSTLVSFDPNSTEVNKLRQEVNIYTAAEGLKKIQDGDFVYHLSRTNEMSSDLFNGRANAIRDMLVNEYQVPCRTHLYRRKQRAGTLIRPCKELCNYLYC